ncbi:hypothetical protein MTO96_007337 [Rhipicephalus appendiculatus]
MNPSIILADRTSDLGRRVGLDIIDLTLKSWECGTGFDGYLSESVALQTAWHAFRQSVPVSTKDIGYLLNIGENYYFSDEQVFFVIYCLSLCDKEVTDPCNAVLKSFAPFSEAFSCRTGSPMRVPDRCGIVSGLRDKLKNISLEKRAPL